MKVVQHSVPRTRRRRMHGVVSVCIALLLGAAACGSNDDDDDKGTPNSPTAVDEAPTTLFDPSVPAGAKPDLPRRIGQSLPAPGELFTTLDDSVRTAAQNEGFEYLSGQANGDSTKQFQQTQGFLSRGVGALVVIDAAPPALEPLQLDAIEDGIAVFCGPFTTCTQQAATDQYAVGLAQGESAVKWIQDELGGEAEVAMFNEDNSPAIKPRAQGVRDALEAGGPGIKIVSDTTLSEVSAEEGLRLTNTILQQHPNVNAWIGADSVLTGTLGALEAAGKAGDETGLFGTDGDAEALAAILEGGPYKSTQAFAYSVLAYAWGQYAADWLEGKSIPQVLVGAPISLDSQESIDAFKAVNASPKEAFEENATTYEWLVPLGNVSYSDNKYLTVLSDGTWDGETS